MSKEHATCNDSTAKERHPAGGGGVLGDCWRAIGKGCSTCELNGRFVCEPATGGDRVGSEPNVDRGEVALHLGEGSEQPQSSFSASDWGNHSRTKRSNARCVPIVARLVLACRICWISSSFQRCCRNRMFEQAEAICKCFRACVRHAARLRMQNVIGDTP